MAKFDPKEHLIKLKGKDYLETKWRLVWFREAFPNGTIHTEPLELTDQRAVFRATVTAIDAQGNVKGSATGTKAQTPQQFKDGYIEKSETGAVGRALAALGFGTQFEPELEEGENVVDSPVTPQRAPQAVQQPRSASQPPNPTPDTSQPVAIVHDEAWQAANRRVHGLLDHAIVSAAVKAKFGVASARFATKEQLDTISDLEDGKADREAVTRWHEWKAKQTANQAELMPDVKAVPNVSHSPTYN